MVILPKGTKASDGTPGVSSPVHFADRKVLRRVDNMVRFAERYFAQAPLPLSPEQDRTGAEPSRLTVLRGAS